MLFIIFFINILTFHHRDVVSYSLYTSYTISCTLTNHKQSVNPASLYVFTNTFTYPISPVFPPQLRHEESIKDRCRRRRRLLSTWVSNLTFFACVISVLLDFYSFVGSYKEETLATDVGEGVKSLHMYTLKMCTFPWKFLIK